jgi:hypothetical protein
MRRSTVFSLILLLAFPALCDIIIAQLACPLNDIIFVYTDSYLPISLKIFLKFTEEPSPKYVKVQYQISKSCGLCYKHVTIVNYTSSDVNKLRASLNDDARVVIYDRELGTTDVLDASLR